MSFEAAFTEVLEQMKRGEITVKPAVHYHLKASRTITKKYERLCERLCRLEQTTEFKGRPLCTYGGYMGAEFAPLSAYPKEYFQISKKAQKLWSDNAVLCPIVNCNE